MAHGTHWFDAQHFPDIGKSAVAAGSVTKALKQSGSTGWFSAKRVQMDVGTVALTI